MATISVGAAVTGGFSLIRREPVAVAIWAVILFAFFALRIALYLPVYGAVLGQIGRGGAQPNLQALLPQIQQAQAFGLLLSIGSVALNTMLACAIFRAILRPEERGFAYLKFGGTELFLSIFTIGIYFVFFIALLVIMIPVAIVIGLTAAQGGAAVGGAGMVAFIAILVALAAAVYFALRLSLLGPLMVDEGQFKLGEAWALTRGKVGSLLLIAFLLFVMAIVAEIVFGGVGLALLFATTGGFANIQTIAQQPSALLAAFAPVIAVVGLLFTLLIAVALPILFAPWACAYRDLKRIDMAAAFS